MKITNELKQLKIRRSLPQIIIPSNKIDMFVDWWNTDIRFQNDIPHSFEEGYVFIENNLMEYNEQNSKILISTLAKQLHTTYRVIEDRWNEFKKMTKNVTLYFKFNNNHCTLILYDITGKLWTTIEFTYGEGGKLRLFEEAPIDLHTQFTDKLESYQDYFNVVCLSLFVTSMWYIATSTKNTKYIYTKKLPTIKDNVKEVKNVKQHKIINTPVYDMTKIKVVNVDKLVQRRKGWTYSHSFQVHGHYRHYKNGKVVFISSYIKGKDKDLQPQAITLEPKEL